MFTVWGSKITPCGSSRPKIPTAIIPQIEPTIWTGMTPTGSSILSFSSNGYEAKARVAPTAPIKTLSIGLMHWQQAEKWF